MIKIAHEAPIDIFEEVQRVTDYDYALVHLLEQNGRYRDTFERAVKKGREVILDNSIFELGAAFDPTKYFHAIKKLNPSWYIIPDALEDCNQTLQNFWGWWEHLGRELERTYDERNKNGIPGRPKTVSTSIILLFELVELLPTIVLIILLNFGFSGLPLSPLGTL